MYFANPGFLWALSLLIVPIIIHLFKFRRYKQVYFPNIKFLKKLSEEQQSKRRLKDILILLSRLIVLAGLVFAFSQPYLGNKGQSAIGNAVSVYVDNSYSMENETEQGVLIDQARKKAEELALAFQPSDRFQLITNDLEPRHQRWVDRRAFLEFLYEVELSPRVVKLSEIQLRQQDLQLKNDGYKPWVFVISDFQKTSADINNVNTNETNTFRLIPLYSSFRQNLFIDTVWFESPIRQTGIAEKLNFSVINQSDKDLDEIPVRFEINGQLKTMANISVKAYGKKDTLIHFTANEKPGYQNARLMLNDHPIVFDDDYFFSYELKNEIKVTEVFKNEDSEENYSVLFNDSLFRYLRLPVTQINFKILGASDLIILNGLYNLSSGLASFLNNWVNEGGNLLVSPGTEINLNDYNSFLSVYGAAFDLLPDTQTVRVTGIEIRDDLFDGVFKEVPKGNALPDIKQHYSIQWPNLDIKKLIALPGDDYLLATKKQGEGKIYLFTVPLNQDWSNWARHALFVTTTLRIAEHSIHTPVIEHTIGDRSRLSIFLSENEDSDGKPFEVKAEDGSMAFIPGQQWLNGKIILEVGNEIKNDGFYNLTNGDSALATIAFNYSREESIMDFLTTEELDEWIAGQPNVSVMNVQNKTIKTNMVREEKPLWKFFILIAIVFLVFEILIIKVMK
jgi:hypothetical protein